MLALVFAVFAATSFYAPLRADTTSLSGATLISSLPCTISAPGVYYLAQDFLSLNLNNANAITVDSPGVTIDLNGHTISDLAAGSGVNASGIFSSNATRLTVRNGTIRGFTYGVCLTSQANYGVLIENMRFLESTYAGILLWPRESIVRRCQMYRIGGSTLPSCPNGVGVLVLGYNDRVQDCDVGELTTHTVYQTIGVYIDQGSNALVVGNRISGAQNGVYFQTSGYGKYRDNLCAASVTTPYTRGINAGNN